MKKSTLRKLFAVVVGLFVGLTAQAQLTATYEAYPASEWGNEKPVSFKLTDVAQALNCDTTTLVKALNSWTAEGSEDANMFFLETTEGLSDDYTQGGKGGFWVNVDGIPQAWSGDNSALRWFNMIGWEAAEGEDGEFTLVIGQFPGQCKAGDSFKPKFVLKLGDAQATIEVTINIVEKPAVDIPEPELLLKNLTIVSEITKEIDQKPRTGYDADKVEIDLKEALAALGITDLSLVQDELKQLLYVGQVYINENDVAMGEMKHDSLTNAPSANGIGFWLKQINDANGELTFECVRAPYGGTQFYAESFAFDAETGLLSCNVGQMPNALEGGNTYYTYFYIIYGNKAISIRFNLNIEKVELGTLENYTMAGEGSINVEMEPQNNYNTKDFKIGVETIAAALGVEVGQIDDFYVLSSDIDFGVKNQEGVGYWLDKEGNIVPWGESAMFYITPKADDYSSFGIGQYPDHMQAGDEAIAVLYFLAGDKYYKLTVNLKIIEPKTFDGNFEVVAKRAIEFQQEVNNEYAWTDGIEIPAEWVEEQIGTSDWVVYGLAKLNEDGTEKEGNARYTKQYNCDPNPGFWLDGDGRSNGWNSNARFGISTAQPSGKISLLQYPGVTNVGDVFKTQLFLVNEENGKMVEFDITYKIVETVEEIVIAGTEEIMLPVANEKIVELDMNKVAEALETTLDVLAQEKVLRGMTAEGSYGVAHDFFEGLTFDAKGFATDNESDIAWYFAMEMKEDGKAALTMYTIGEVAEDLSVIAQMCFQVAGKQYVFNVKFVSEAIYTDGIQTVTARNNDGQIYDLQGRQVQNTRRGLYIQNGRKFMVK